MEEPPAWLADPYEANWPNTVAVCAIMKEENAKDVQEFLEYHRCAFSTMVAPWCHIRCIYTIFGPCTPHAIQAS